jgi:putative FmdB family regulatory protein
MPVYEYACTECGAQVEAWQSFSEDPLETCESCGGPMKKLISQTTFHLKGSGWYVTDYASKSGANHSPATKDEKPPSEKKSPSAEKSTSKKETSSSKKTNE